MLLIEPSNIFRGAPIDSEHPGGQIELRDALFKQMPKRNVEREHLAVVADDGDRYLGPGGAGSDDIPALAAAFGGDDSVEISLDRLAPRFQIARF